MEMEQRDSVVGTLECNNQNWEDYMKEGKAFQISQNELLNAYKAVKANKGARGVKVKGVEIPKKNGKKRLLGIPMIEDRVVQMVLKTDWNQCWNGCFMKTHMATDLINQHWTQ